MTIATSETVVHDKHGFLRAPWWWPFGRGDNQEGKSGFQPDECGGTVLLGGREHLCLAKNDGHYAHKCACNFRWAA